MSETYIGIDVHQKQSFYCVLNKSGQCLGHEKMATDVKSLDGLIARYREGGLVHVALEAGGSSWWVAQSLKSSGALVHVVNAHDLKLIAHSKRKTDKYDSKVLADLLRCGGLPERVYQPSGWGVEMRSWLKVRKWQVRQRSSAIVRAKAMMRHYGISVKAGMFRTAGSWEEVMGMNPSVGRLLAPIYEVWRLMVEQIRATEKVLLEKLPESDERMKLLMSIPGIGPVTAWTLIALVEEVVRFQRADQLVSYAGLVPWERSSGERVVTGSITKHGRSELRDVFIQAAWGAMRSSDPGAARLKQFFYRIMYRRCSQVAIVALAKKLLIISYYVWKRGVPFAGDRSEGMAA